MNKKDKMFGTAVDLVRRREIDRAEQMLRELLLQHGEDGGALHLLGLLAGRGGRDAECVELLERAIALAPGEQSEASGLLLAAAHRRAGRWSEAEATYRAVLRARPASAEALMGLGTLLASTDKAGEAVIALRQAVAVAPDLATAHGALAAALHAIGATVEASESAERALELAPENGDCVADLAVIRNAQGRFAEATALCRAALAAGQDARLLNTLGIALKEQGRIDEAAAQFERAIAIAPGFVDALYNLAAVLKELGRTDEAVATLREVVAKAPELAAARIALCMAHLPPVYVEQDEIDRRRANYARELDALAAHVENVGAAWLAPGVGAAQPFLLAYQGYRDADLQRLYGMLMCRAMAEAFPPASLAARPAAEGRIRVGVVCGHIRDHSVWRVPTRGWVGSIDRSRLELVAFHTCAEQDAETGRARRLFDRFVQGPCSTEEWREQIVDFRPHALLYPEIGMDPMVARLAAMRLAPVQYASWGHPSTSGYPTIDFFLSSDDMEPEDADRDYTEALVRLPGLSTPIQLPPKPRSIPTRQSLALPEDAIVYWSGQSLAKYLPVHDDLYADIALHVPKACFVFVEAPGSPLLTQRFRSRLSRSFADYGLDAERHCRFLSRMPPVTLRAAMGCADLVLDGVGWSGCNTLLDALSHGLPIITTPGDTMRSRHGAAILRRIGWHDLVACDMSDFVRKAVALGRDSECREALRHGTVDLRAALNDERPVPALEKHMARSTGSRSVD